MDKSLPAGMLSYPVQNLETGCQVDLAPKELLKSHAHHRNFDDSEVEIAAGVTNLCLHINVYLGIDKEREGSHTK